MGIICVSSGPRHVRNKNCHKVQSPHTWHLHLRIMNFPPTVSLPLTCLALFIFKIWRHPPSQITFTICQPTFAISAQNKTQARILALPFLSSLHNILENTVTNNTKIHLLTTWAQTKEFLHRVIKIWIWRRTNPDLPNVWPGAQSGLARCFNWLST